MSEGPLDRLDHSILESCCAGRCVGWPQRVYIVAVICVLTFAQSIIASTWSPIVQISESSLHWEDNTIGLLQIWFIVIAVASGLPLIYLMENKGLRLAILIASTAMVLGAMLRTIPVASDIAFTVLNNVGTALLAVSMPVFPTCSSVVAATWFPADYRSMATASIVGSAILGSAVSFVLGPAFVHTAPEDFSNLLNSSVSASPEPELQQTEFTDLLWRTYAKSEIIWYLFLQFVLALAGWVCVILYFPKKPADDPSVSAGFGRDEFFQGLKKLIRKSAFWVMCISFAFMVGIMSVWVPVMGIGLRPLDIGGRTIGWIGMSGTLACVPYALISSWLGQRYRKMKMVIMVSMAIASVCFFFFALLCMGYLPNNLVAVYVVLVVGGACSLGCVPTYFELTCECCFPIYEGLCTIILGFSSTIASIIFFIPILTVPNTPFEMVWVSWAPFVSVTGALIAIIFLKEQYNRLGLDKGETAKAKQEDPESDKAPLLENSEAPDYSSTDKTGLLADGPENFADTNKPDSEQSPALAEN